MFPTERRRRFIPLARCLLGAAIAVCMIAEARAHGPEPKVEREIVRLQGFLDARPEGATVLAEIALDVFGVEHLFHVSDWQQLGFTEAAVKGGKPDARIALQGDRATLARIEGARPGQRVTLLGERRLGSTDLFILAADLCPER